MVHSIVLKFEKIWLCSTLIIIRNEKCDGRMNWRTDMRIPIYPQLSSSGGIITKMGALDSQPQVIKFTSCLTMVGGSLQVLQWCKTTKTGRHDIAEISLKVVLNTIN